MEQLSLLEKFKILFDNIFEHPLFVVILLVPAIMFLLQKKHGKKAFVLVYLLVIIAVLFVGGEVIFELFDNLMHGLFMTLYFPNFITLFVVVVLCSIIALFSFFSKKMYKVNKIINITGFAIVHMLFLLILSLVKANNINIYADNALYSNSDVLTLMQLLIGTFTLQVVAILIINGINKVTDILDRRSTPLAEEINEQIIDLEKSKKTNGLIKNIEIDNTKFGYINVADKKVTSKPKLKPFKFDVSKLESITLNVGDTPKKEIERVIEKPILLPNEKSKPIKFINKAKNIVKPNLLKFVENTKNKVTNNGLNIINDDKSVVKSEKSNLVISDKGSLENQNEPKFVNKKIQGKVIEKKPDLFKLEDSPIKVISKVEKPKLVHEARTESTDLVDNLNIVDIQSTLDTVVNYHLMKWVNLENYNDKAAVDNLQIPNFGKMVMVLEKCRLYKKMR